MNPTSNHKVAGLIPGLAQWVKDLVLLQAVAIDHRFSLDPMLLWLWYRLTAAAVIQPLAWESPCAAGVVIKRKKKIFNLTAAHYLTQEKLKTVISFM